FNNILAIVIGNLSLLKAELTNHSGAIKRIETIEQSAKRAADLTKQLLGFSRSKAQQQQITNINTLITDMDNLLARTVTPQIDVVHQLHTNLWHVAIDQGDFQDTLINLILNARDAMSGSGRLILKTENCVLDNERLKLDPDMNPGKYVVLSVCDSGEGITIEQQKRIFEPFFTTKEQGKGTGLGLAMVFGFVNRSGGFIKVFSERNVGTTFRIYLPKCEGEIQTTEIQALQTENLPRGQEVILVVDDEEMLLELAQETLEALAYRVLIATNAKQALVLLAEEPDIALLITDVLMPGGMNGYELAEQAIENRPNLKVILASGYASKTEIGDVKSSFSSDILLKPYGLSELAKRVRAILDSD
ncbi:MAG: response regulator, partial [Gammaproteobacteria bacterium]|nr:response regulator [Gammaproteobacteria bacterium]